MSRTEIWGGTVLLCWLSHFTIFLSSHNICSLGLAVECVFFGPILTVGYAVGRGKDRNNETNDKFDHDVKDTMKDNDCTTIEMKREVFMKNNFPIFVVPFVW